jgi:hypothetical protein
MDTMRVLVLSFCLCFGLCADDRVELKQYPVNSLEGVPDQDGVRLNRRVSSDGEGSIELTARRSTTFRLYETGDVDVENATLLYHARVKTKDVKGSAYLEMWCSFPGQGEFFSRGLQYSLTGTHGWRTIEIPFFLRKGENPDNVKLNVVIDGSGKFWIDEIRLLAGPLPEGY